MNGGMLLAQSMQMLKEMGASKDLMTEFLAKTMMLDAEQAALYSSIVDARPPGGADAGMGGEP